MASLEHFKCAGSENVTSFIVMAKTESSHEQGIYINTGRSTYRLRLYDSDYDALTALLQVNNGVYNNAPITY